MCEIMMPVVKQVCDELRIPFMAVPIGLMNTLFYRKDSYTRTLSREWIEKFGNPHQKMVIEHLERTGILQAMQQTTAYPNIIVQADMRRGRVEFVFGGAVSRKQLQKFRRNLFLFLYRLKRAVK